MVFKFTIDDALNPYLRFASRDRIMAALPAPIARFLGHRDPSGQSRWLHGRPAAQIPDYVLWIDILVSTFVGMLLLTGVFSSPNVFSDHHHAPIMIASYAATGILCFNTVTAPLAQPRNIIAGHFISSIIGVGIQKLFALSEAGRDQYKVAGPLAVAVASVAMTVLNCVHPPAGASALLPSVDPEIRLMGWWYLPTHLVSSVLVISAAAVCCNVLRVYPVFWWTPLALRKQPEVSEEPADAVESVKVTESHLGGRLETEESVFHESKIEEIVISPEGIRVPAGFDLAPIDIQFLEETRGRLMEVVKRQKSAIEDSSV